jgi:hypothetical protein
MYVNKIPHFPFVFDCLNFHHTYGAYLHILHLVITEVRFYEQNDLYMANGRLSLHFHIGNFPAFSL